jgi:hypothetical protein
MPKDYFGEHVAARYDSDGWVDFTAICCGTLLKESRYKEAFGVQGPVVLGPHVTRAGTVGEMSSRMRTRRRGRTNRPHA